MPCRVDPIAQLTPVHHASYLYILLITIISYTAQEATFCRVALSWTHLADSAVSYLTLSMIRSADSNEDTHSEDD